MNKNIKATRERKERPNPTPMAYHSESERCKDIKILDNPDRKKVLNLLQNGFHLSAIDISRILNVHDSRSHLRYLKKVYPIQSYWIKSKGTRFKVYFIQFRDVSGKSNEGGQHEKE